MTKIDIFSGFLGAGKTTLIKKLLKEAYVGEKVVLIENEFGEIGIDGGFLKDAGVEITEMNSGCICCSLVGDFTKALKKVINEYAPDRVIIEPSGVGKLSDVIKAAEKVVSKDVVLNAFTTVVDAGKCKMYLKNFGEFFGDQIKNANSVILSHTDVTREHKVEEAVVLVRSQNAKATIVSTPWESIEGKLILNAMENATTIKDEIEKLEEEHHYEECSCGCHDHEHHHHADEVFASIGVETSKKFTVEQIKFVLDAFDEDNDCGMILRAKGMVASEDGKWIHFDYVPGESNIRFGAADVIGKLCVIGSKIKGEKIKELFGVN